MTELLTPQSLGGLKIYQASEGEHRFCAIVYGDGGIGKTNLVCSAYEVPELCPILLLNIENGAQSIQEKYPGLHVIDIPNFKKLEDVFLELHKKDGAGYRTVLLDNLTEGQRLGMEYLFKKTGIPSFSDPDSGAWGDGTWNKNSEQIRKCIRLFRSLPMNVIIVAWARDYSKTKLPKWKPAFSPAIADEVPGMVNDVYYYHMGEDGKRRLQTTTTNTVIAKDRTGKLPPYIDNPTMKVIYEYWTGERVYTPSSSANNVVPGKVNKQGVKK